jgi:hypothetical protein
MNMNLTRLTVNINQPTKLALKELSASESVTITEVVRRSISIYRLLVSETKAGRQIVTMDSDGKNKRELVLMP